MSTDAIGPSAPLTACRELLASHPGSIHIRDQVEALEAALPDNPGIAVSFCRTIIETTCKTILTDRGRTFESSWEAPKLVSEALKYLDLGRTENDTGDSVVRKGAEQLVRGLNQIIQGVVEIRNARGAGAHGTDAYAPALDSAYSEILARATDAVVGLLFRTHLNTLRPDTLVRFRYRDHPDFDEFLDANLWSIPSTRRSGTRERGAVPNRLRSLPVGARRLQGKSGFS